MKEWKIVKSVSNQHPVCGYPLGEILCRSYKEAEDFIEKSEFHDLYVEQYKDKNE